MYKGRRITYNPIMAEFFRIQGCQDAFVLFYLIKMTHSNSVIFTSEPMDLFYKLKSIKALPLNFSKERFKKALYSLYFYGYLKKDENGNLCLRSVKYNIGYYRPKIKYNRTNINFNIVQRLLLVQILTESKRKQEWTMTARANATTDLKAGMVRMYPRRKPKKDIQKSFGECRFEGVSFSYRKIAKLLGVSLASVHGMVKWIEKNTTFKFEKATECKHKVRANQTFSEAKKIFYPNTYCFMNKSRFLVAILGTSIIS
jgi:hypothetical protein